MNVNNNYSNRKRLENAQESANKIDDYDENSYRVNDDSVADSIEAKSNFVANNNNNNNNMLTFVRKPLKPEKETTMNENDNQPELEETTQSLRLRGDKQRRLPSWFMECITITIYK